MKEIFNFTIPDLKSNPVDSQELADPIIIKHNLEIDSANLIIAIGSGTINDLAKYISHATKKSFIIIPTATSMNGYISANSSLSLNYHKKTIQCTKPAGFYCDLNLIKTASCQLNSAGVADILAYYSCKFDWLLSHFLFETPINWQALNLIDATINDIFLNYEKLNIADSTFLEKIIIALILMGESMNLSGGSYPASQSEHLIAHAINAKFPLKFVHIYHGNQVACAISTSLNLQQKLINSVAVPTLKAINHEEIYKYFSETNKILLPEILEQINEKQKVFSKQNYLKNLSPQEWNQIKQKIVSQCPNHYFIANNLVKIFNHFNINHLFFAQEIGKNQFEECVNLARLIRNRITCLDFNY